MVCRRRTVGSLMSVLLLDVVVDLDAQILSLLGLVARHESREFRSLVISGGPWQQGQLRAVVCGHMWS